MRVSIIAILTLLIGAQAWASGDCTIVMNTNIGPIQQTTKFEFKRIGNNFWASKIVLTQRFEEEIFSSTETDPNVQNERQHVISVTDPTQNQFRKLSIVDMPPYGKTLMFMFSLPSFVTRGVPRPSHWESHGVTRLILDPQNPNTYKGLGGLGTDDPRVFSQEATVSKGCLE